MYSCSVSVLELTKQHPLHVPFGQNLYEIVSLQCGKYFSETQIC